METADVVTQPDDVLLAEHLVQGRVAHIWTYKNKDGLDEIGGMAISAHPHEAESEEWIGIGFDDPTTEENEAQLFFFKAPQVDPSDPTSQKRRDNFYFWMKPSQYEWRIASDVNALSRAHAIAMFADTAAKLSGSTETLDNARGAVLLAATIERVIAEALDEIRVRDEKAEEALTGYSSAVTRAVGTLGLRGATTSEE